MTHEITLKVGSPHVLRDHIAEAVVGYSQGSDIRHTLEDLLAQVGEQLPKPAIVEPAEFGSLIRAEAPHHYKALWTPSPTSGDHYWMSEKGYVEVWSELTDVEVLRVGLGEPDDTDMTAEEFDQAFAEATPVDVNVSLAKTKTYIYQPHPVDEAFNKGMDQGGSIMAGRIHNRLQKLLAESITSERKNALEKAIQAVEELAP